jgi:L-threonylcarbamoyladenylate synthase
MQDDLKKALEVLQNGGTILYATDTIWGIGCDATNAKAIEKIYKIKFRTAEKSLIILADSMNMIEKYVAEIPELAKELVVSYKAPLTIIYNKARKLPKNLVPKDGTIAIRIPKDEFCIKLIGMLGKPITSTSANLSGDPNPLTFSKVSPKIKEAVDYICTTNQLRVDTVKPSTILKVNTDGQIQILRN